jgi:hypothetical protein
MMHAISILPALGCLLLMVGGGFVLRLARRVPLARMAWLGRRTRGDRPRDAGR